jgi:glycosyltransferase involved in cell wall biosynthesis
LSTGVDRPAKNLATLIRAFVLLRAKMPEFRLVLAGQLRSADRVWVRKSTEIDSATPSTIDLVNELGLANDVVVTGFVSDEKLGALYRGSSLFVLPSLFEGFGMPAIEALMLGAPTLVTGLPVLREVTLGGASYIDNPRDEHEIAERMHQLLAMGGTARPSIEFQEKIRGCFAPRTIAQQYLATMLGASL